MNTREMRSRVEESLAESAFVKLLLLQKCSDEIVSVAQAAVKALKAGRSIYLFGNGGSAADSQHIAAELEGRFLKNRRALPAMALTTNTSSLTAIGNDFSYEDTFSRPVEAHVRKGDMVIAISTSGNSPNVLAAVKLARKKGAVTVGFTNEKGGKLAGLVHHCIRVPSTDTQRVQECHIAVGHVLCGLIEGEMF